MDKVPTEEEWAKLIKKIPVETIELDEHGHYDQKKNQIFMTGWLMVKGEFSNADSSRSI